MKSRSQLVKYFKCSVCWLNCLGNCQGTKPNFLYKKAKHDIRSIISILGREACVSKS